MSTASDSDKSREITQHPEAQDSIVTSSIQMYKSISIQDWEEHNSNSNVHLPSTGHELSPQVLSQSHAHILDSPRKGRLSSYKDVLNNFDTAGLSSSFSIKFEEPLQLKVPIRHAKEDKEAGGTFENESFYENSQVRDTVPGVLRLTKRRRSTIQRMKSTSRPCTRIRT